MSQMGTGLLLPKFRTGDIATFCAVLSLGEEPDILQPSLADPFIARMVSTAQLVSLTSSFGLSPKKRSLIPKSSGRRQRCAGYSQMHYIPSIAILIVVYSNRHRKNDARSRKTASSSACD
ncbi:MAG TPA: hypothetical protein DDZ51_18135 [Planctomycetaceae bacterium]|nr:hypothetical protein [Planctomycetaceae bacterium]